MANVQTQFEQFHEAIKLKRFKENAILREKRDIILNKLREKLPDVFAAYDEEYPQPEFRDQGSYDMGTGVKPLNGDYDIDQGAYFPISTDDYADPVVLKQRVHEALTGHTDDVCIRRSCLTVFYQRAGEHLYHVDLAVYTDGSKDLDGKARLAKGKENSSEEHRVWEVSAQGLKDTIFAKFEGLDRDQFRRVVRYLKRWRDVNFSSDGNAAPLGVGLTVVAYYDLGCRYADPFAGKPDDCAALRDLVAAVLGRFTTIGYDPGTLQPVRRLFLQLPVEPYSDLFARMTDTQMTEFEGELEQLRDALNVAATTVDPVEACKELRKVFGRDFPVPEPEETAKKHAPAIVSSSSSA